MKKHLLLAAAAVTLAFPAAAQDAEPEGPPSPNQIVAEAPASEWVSIAAEDLLVMTLAPDTEGNARKVVIQLMPAPFSQGWTDNIRTFARAEWYDNITVNRVQDNYVVQWVDPNYDNPEATGDAKALPEGLKVMGEDEYVLSYRTSLFEKIYSSSGQRDAVIPIRGRPNPKQTLNRLRRAISGEIVNTRYNDPYSLAVSFIGGFPVGMTMSKVFSPRQPIKPEMVWPIHCYGMIGVGRGYSPDTGSGAELYTVIGHAPRHLDRNIALVGRIVEGMEHLSSLPRGSGALGFYTEEEFGKRAPILSVRVASDLPEGEQPSFEYLSTEGETFAKYADSRANRRDPFFIVPAGGADICNIPVPVRRVSPGE